MAEGDQTEQTVWKGSSSQVTQLGDAARVSSPLAVCGSRKTHESNLP